MTPIVPDVLWIGHAGDGRDLLRLVDAGLRAVVRLAVEEPSPSTLRDLIDVRIPLLDGPGNPPEFLLLAIRAVATLVEARVPTLVCCGAGMSRSPCIAALALASVLDEPPESALARVARLRPCDISPGLWNEARSVWASSRSQPSTREG